MEFLATAVHYGNIAFTIILSILGAGFGAGYASVRALHAINMQPKAHKEITKAAMIGLALVETGSILSLIVCLFMIAHPPTTLAMALGEIGTALSLGLSACIIGLVSSLPIESTCLSIARQPFFSQKIINLMLITQTIMQTAAIFGFIIGLFFIQFSLTPAMSVEYALSLACAGFAIGFGSLGPAIGLARFAQAICLSAGVNRKRYPRLISFAFMAGAIIETPLIFALLVSIVISIYAVTAQSFMDVVRMLAASLCISLATFMGGHASSLTARAASEQMPLTKTEPGMLSQTSLITQGIIDTSAIYALLVSVALVLFIK